MEERENGREDESEREVEWEEKRKGTREAERERNTKGNPGKAGKGTRSLRARALVHPVRSLIIFPVAAGGKVAAAGCYYPRGEWKDIVIPRRHSSLAKQPLAILREPASLPPTLSSSLPSRERNCRGKRRGISSDSTNIWIEKSLCPFEVNYLANIGLVRWAAGTDPACGRLTPDRCLEIHVAYAAVAAFKRLAWGHLYLLAILADCKKPIWRNISSLRSSTFASVSHDFLIRLFPSLFSRQSFELSSYFD